MKKFILLLPILLPLAPVAQTSARSVSRKWFPPIIGFIKTSTMKYAVCSVCLLFQVMLVRAQSYPQPEFSDEIYYLKKDNASTLVRLEKQSSKLESKIKGAGFGGFENGYTIDGERSNARLNQGHTLSFVFYTGMSSGDGAVALQDSVMQAQGIDPSGMMGNMGSMDDPARTVSLYKTDAGKGKRKILMQKTGGMLSGGKIGSSNKYLFSVKKVRDGYWELVIDKTLPKGEYAFTSASYNSQAMDGSLIIFAFGVD